MIHNIKKPNKELSKHTVETKNGRLRRVLKVLNVSGLSWTRKKNLIQKHLIDTFGTIPSGVVFDKRKTKDINNPDGLRVFVRCNWIKVNRFYDYKGEFKIGTLIEAINRQVENKTKKSILAPLK